MSAGSLGRSLSEDVQAECPFSVNVITDPPQDLQEARRPKRRRDNGQRNERGVQVHNSPFHPTGIFRTHDNMKVYYCVEPRRSWLDMTRYNSFVLNGVKYFADDFVYVVNEDTFEKQKQSTATDPVKKMGDYWVARILEIRASDEHHVYAHVCWMYWPEDLPGGTMDGKTINAGRQPYHGMHEMIASNHMDVINVVSVAMAAKVQHWIETDDDEVQDALYWRQAFTCTTSQLSTVELVCRCSTPANPDKVLVACSEKDCEKWMHHECLLDDVLTRVWERLGMDRPHKTIKTEEDVSNSAAGPSRAAAGRFSRSAATKRPRRGQAARRPYEGQFEAELRTNDGPSVWEITDLRSNIRGGDRTWTEKVFCLICNSVIE